MSATINNDKIILTNPITNEEIGQLDICSESNFLNIVESAENYNNWKELSLKQRCKYINKFKKVILKNRHELQKILINETGKKEFDAFTELFTTLEHLREITKIAKEEKKRIENQKLKKKVKV